MAFRLRADDVVFGSSLPPPPPSSTTLSKLSLTKLPGSAHALGYNNVIKVKQPTHSAIKMIVCADPEGGAGVRTPPPPKNHKNVGFLSNTGPDPFKNHKATNPAFNVGPSSARQRNAI